MLSKIICVQRDRERGREGDGLIMSSSSSLLWLEGEMSVEFSPLPRKVTVTLECLLLSVSSFSLSIVHVDLSPRCDVYHFPIDYMTAVCQYN